MDKYTVDLDQVLNDFEYSELTDQIQDQAKNNTRHQQQNPILLPKTQTKHSITNVFHSLNEYLNTTIAPNPDITPHVSSDNNWQLPVCTIKEKNVDIAEEIRSEAGDFVKSEVEGFKSPERDLATGVDSKSQIGDFKREKKELQSEVGDFRSEVGSFRSEIGGFRSEVEGFKSDVTDFKSNVVDLKNLEAYECETEDSKNEITVFNKKFPNFVGEVATQNSVKAERTESIQNIIDVNSFDESVKNQVEIGGIIDKNSEGKQELDAELEVRNDFESKSDRNDSKIKGEVKIGNEAEVGSDFEVGMHDEKVPSELEVGNAVEIQNEKAISNEEEEKKLEINVEKEIIEKTRSVLEEEENTRKVEEEKTKNVDEENIVQVALAEKCDVSINANKTDLIIKTNTVPIIIKSTNQQLNETDNIIKASVEIPKQNGSTNEIIKVGFDNDIDLDETELNQYLNDLENEYESHGDDEADEEEIIINQVGDDKKIMGDELVGCEETKQNGVDEKMEINLKSGKEIEQIDDVEEEIVEENSNNSRPNDLPLPLPNMGNEDGNNKREINLIGEPGSTPYNNVYINKELPQTKPDSDTECSTSASPTFSDISSETTSSSSAPSTDTAVNETNTNQVTVNLNDEKKSGDVEEVGEAAAAAVATIIIKPISEDVEEALIAEDSNNKSNEGEQAIAANVLSSNEELSEENNGPGIWLGKQAPLWIPDDETTSCLHCDMKFTVLKRRHHCRACGLVLCSKCCNLKYRLEYLDSEARVCMKCYEILNKDGGSTGSSEATQYSPNNSPLHHERQIQPQPNPNNPLEYCSTVPPLQQINNTNINNPPPAVMVPVGVLKRKGSNKNRINKSVMFCDGIRPGSDLTNLDNDFSYNENKIVKKKTEKIVNVKMNRGYPILDSDTKSFIPNNDNSLPPTISIFKSDISYTDCVNSSNIVKTLWNESLTFALQLNLYVHLKIVNMDCCVNKTVWCFTTEGLINVGQDEIIILLELLEDENLVPKDIFLHINHIYLDAVKGISVKEMGLSLHDTSNFLNSKNHAGFVYIRPSFQCLQNIVKPQEPFLFGILIHRWETPWAKLFPLRLILRLGAEYRYYPSPIISTRFRDSVFVEIGHTIINLLADFRNFSYTLPQIRGLTIHMEDKNTTITIPANRYDQVMKSMNNSSDHILAFAGNFSCQADSYLVCIQDTQGNENSYTTHAINIHNKPRKVTGASFIVFNGALKSTSGLTAKSSIVEDGLMIQIPSEHMLQIRESLRNMRNHTIQCGCINAASDETVNIIWGEADVNFNINVLSPVDNQAMSGIPSIRVHNGKDYICNSGNRLIRWTEVFIIQNGEESSRNQDPVDISKVSESIAKATCNALVKYLDLLVSNNFFKIGIRTTLHIENVSYAAGSNAMKLPPIYMKSLDNELIPVLHRITSNNFSENAIILELIFRILNV